MAKENISAKKLFCTSNVDDLPKAYAAILPKKSRGLCLKDLILGLFKHKSDLSIGEIIVGLYRKHKKEFSISAIYGVTGRLARNKTIVIDSSGKYKLSIICGEKNG